MLENNKNSKLENFTVLSNLITDPLCVIDEKGTFSAVNQAMTQVLGFGEQELVGKNVLDSDFLDQENKTILLKNLEKRMKGLDVASYEVKATAKNGEIKFFEIKGKKIWYANQNVDLVVLHDITEQKKKTEERIRLSEEKYKNLFENAPDVIVTIDLTGKITSVNKAIMQHGFKENEIVGNSIFKLVPTEYNQKMLTGLKNIAAGNPAQGEIEILTPNGKRSTEYNSNPIWLNGKVVGYQTIIRDITERKKTEEALRKSEEKHRKLFEESMDAIFVADTATGIIVDCNPAASKLVGREKSELVGQHQSIIHHKEQIEGVFTRSFKEHLKDQTKTHETQIMMKTGEIRDVTVKGTIFELNGRKLIQGTFRDITEQKQLELEIKRLAKFPSENPNPIFRVDGKGTILYGNQAGASLLSVWNSKVGECAPNRISQLVANALASNQRIECEETCGTKTFSFLFTPITLEGYVNIYANDITERKITQNALEESEEKFQTITNSVKDAIILVDDETKVVYWNPTAEKMFGYSTAEAIGKEVHELVVPKTMCTTGRKCIRIGVKQFASIGIGGGMNGNVELLGRRKDGTQFPVKLSITPIKLQGKWNAVEVVKDITQMKQAEQKLREAEKRYHILFSQAPLGVLVIDPQTAKPVEFNDVAHTQLGYSREEFSKLHISDFEAKEKADETNAHVARMVRDGGGEFETKHRTKNGEIRDVLVTTRAVELAGKPFLHCIFHDITEIRKVQKALMESEAEYRQLVELAQEGIWAVDNNFNTVFVNPHMAQMLGYTESEMIGKSIFDFLFKADVEKTTQYLSQFKQGMNGNFEYEFMRKDGSRVNISIAAAQIKDDEGSCLGTLALVSDITLRKKTELSLKKSEEKFRNLAEQSPNIIFINQKGKVVYANTEAEEATGYKKEEFYSSEFNFMDLIAPESKEFVKSQFIKHLKCEDAHPYEHKLISKKGQTIDVINSTKVIDYNGEPAILGIETDVTESKRLKEKLEQYSIHLEDLVKEKTVKLEQTQAQLVKSERLAAIGELAGMVGHDLRNPLTGIKNAAYYLKKKGTTCPEGQAKEMLEIIDKAIDHSNKIINDLLDYSREMHLELTEIETSALLNEAIRMIQVPNRIQVVNHVLGETWFRVDADKMMRVFINLIKNATDAMPEKGTLEIRSRQTGGKVEIAFADTGMGIPEDVLPKLFSPLFTTKAQGMGFGLAICKRIVESHGGTITVKTAVNKGTTFTITLPVKPKVEVGGEKTWIDMPESLLSTTKA